MGKKKKPTKAVEGRKPPMIPVANLKKIAYEIATLRPNEEIIYNTISDLYGEAFDKGYQRRINDRRRFVSRRDAKINESFDSVYRTIEDMIHGGIVPAKEEVIKPK